MISAGVLFARIPRTMGLCRSKVHPLVRLPHVEHVKSAFGLHEEQFYHLWDANETRRVWGFMGFGVGPWCPFIILKADHELRRSESFARSREVDAPVTFAASLALGA